MSATTPPSNLMFAQSPPNMEGPVAFVAPGLAEETLMGVGQMNHIGVTFQIFRRFQVIYVNISVKEKHQKNLFDMHFI